MPASTVPPMAPTPLAGRLRAAGIHLALSMLLAGATVALVWLLWYPSPLPVLLGVDTILLIMLAVDVVLGPAITLIVFDRRKPRLALDLAVIGAIQLAALGYGMHTIEQGRPAFVVLVKDRFEVVAPAELQPAAREAAAGNPLALPDRFRPRWVAVKMPESNEERTAILFESLATGRDLQHHPKHYVPLASESVTMLERSLPIDRLRALNPGRDAEIDAAVRATGRPESSLRYLPLRGPARDGAVLVDPADARALAIVPVVPW